MATPQDANYQTKPGDIQPNGCPNDQTKSGIIKMLPVNNGNTRNT